MVAFEERKNQTTRRKTPRWRAEKQQTQPTYDAGSGNQTRVTLVGGECSHKFRHPCSLSHENSLLCCSQRTINFVLHKTKPAVYQMWERSAEWVAREKLFDKFEIQNQAFFFLDTVEGRLTHKSIDQNQPRTSDFS